MDAAKRQEFIDLMLRILRTPPVRLVELPRPDPTGFTGKRAYYRYWVLVEPPPPCPPDGGGGGCERK